MIAIKLAHDVRLPLSKPSALIDGSQHKQQPPPPPPPQPPNESSLSTGESGSARVANEKHVPWASIEARLCDAILAADPGSGGSQSSCAGSAYYGDRPLAAGAWQSLLLDAHSRREYRAFLSKQLMRTDHVRREIAQEQEDFRSLATRFERAQKRLAARKEELARQRAAKRKAATAEATAAEAERATVAQQQVDPEAASQSQGKQEAVAREQQ